MSMMISRIGASAPVPAAQLRHVLKNLGMGPQAVEPFEWPEIPSMSAFRSYCREALATVFVKRANTKMFAAWLVEVGEDQDISNAHLHNLYEEWCCLERVRPLKRKALEIDLDKSGIASARPRSASKRHKGKRPSVYSVRKPELVRKAA